MGPKVSFFAIRVLCRSAGNYYGCVQWILNPEGFAARATLRRTLLRANGDVVVAIGTYNYELQLALVAEQRGLGLVLAS